MIELILWEKAFFVSSHFFFKPDRHPWGAGGGEEKVLAIEASMFWPWGMNCFGGSLNTGAQKFSAL